MWRSVDFLYFCQTYRKPTNLHISYDITIRHHVFCMIFLKYTSTCQRIWSQTICRAPLGHTLYGKYVQWYDKDKLFIVINQRFFLNILISCKQISSAWSSAAGILGMNIFIDMGRVPFALFFKPFFIHLCSIVSCNPL